MPNVSDIMTAEVQTIAPGNTLREAALLMVALDVGALPVCTGSRLLGMVTDRDITVRGVAQGLDCDAAVVGEVMSTNLHFCTGEQDAEEAMRTMGEKQIRRVPVIDVDFNLVGILSLGDLALRHPGHIDQTVREISGPASETAP